jgi:hypothetical protein
LAFIRSLAFLGWLQGQAVGYRGWGESGVLFGIGDQQSACWLGPDVWRVTGDAGRQLAERLWEMYLAAGGPWPTEFRLRAAVSAVAAADGNGLLLSYRRRGRLTEQVWELERRRERPALP